MDNDERGLEPQTPEPSQTPDPPEAPAGAPGAPRNAVEGFYEHFRGVPLKYLDIFIGVCTAALVILIILGFLKGHGYF